MNDVRAQILRGTHSVKFYGQSDMVLAIPFAPAQRHCWLNFALRAPLVDTKLSFVAQFRALPSMKPP